MNPTPDAVTDAGREPDPAGPADPSAVMSARGVVKRFGSVSVLNGVSMDVRSREVVVLIGPSGSGKTTFLRCLNHLERKLADPGRAVAAPSLRTRLVGGGSDRIRNVLAGKGVH